MIRDSIGAVGRTAGIAVIVLCLGGPAFGATTVSIDVRLDASGAWTASWSTDAPIPALVFLRRPDHSRLDRWQPLDPEQELVLVDGVETLRRRDGAAFRRAVVALTPTYIPLPADYAPFSPFSDGGVLFHTGRLFACARSCDDGPEAWPVRLSVPPGRHVVRDGAVRPRADAWTDGDSGRQVYVGPQRPVDEGHVLAIVDPGLPETLRTALAEQLPPMMARFETRLGRLPRKPMLLASHAPMPDGRWGRQGGVLPDQVFMHWYGERSLVNIDADEVLGFFAHELAHLYQGARFPNTDHAWIHEGVADWMSAAVRRNLGQVSAAALRDRLDRLHRVCTEHIVRAGSFTAARAAEFGLNYACGHVIADRLDRAIRDAGHADGLFRGWRRFSALLDLGLPADADGYAGALGALLPVDVAERLRVFAAGDGDSAAWSALTGPVAD